jgi:hypothetical protein
MLTLLKLITTPRLHMPEIFIVLEQKEKISPDTEIQTISQISRDGDKRQERR